MTMPADPKDGFDLIEYPCDFAFKAMCRAVNDEPAIDHIKSLLKPLSLNKSLLSIKTNASRTGKFESVTLNVKLDNREQLERIYKVIAASPRVVMTL